MEHIAAAHSSIDLVVYDIGSEDVVDALIEAKHRAVQVRVIVDSVNSTSATPQELELEDAGISLKRIAGVSRDLLHDKFILFDGKIASTPSYNRSSKSLRGKGEEAFTDDSALISTLQKQFESVFCNHDRACLSILDPTTQKN